MWKDGRQTKTNPKTSPEQSAIFHIVREINKTNVLTKKTAPPPWRPSYIYKTNLFTKFHNDWPNNVTSRVFTSFFYYINIRKLPTPTWQPCYSTDWNHFQTQLLYQGTFVLTKFHENWAKNKNAPPTGVHVFSPIWTIFLLLRDIKKTNGLTNFHDDWTKIVTSRVFTRFLYSQITKTAPPTGGHVIQRTGNILTKFHENWAKNVTSRVENAPPTGDHVFSPIWTIFELVRYINKTNVLTNFHDDWAKIVTSRVFTRKTAPPTGGHVFQQTGTTFELNQHIIKTNILTYFELDRDIIGTNPLTKFHEDRTINVASRVFTNKCGRTTDGRTTDKDWSQKLT
ncbi:hypothetical protein DPMN_088172 [Dreissena polymorpha]|uniref:Uncharacterized protein n=1 Tax=Dreissena polymorpha TaxID=45954 RepID=A0A9D4QX27_DREPO|nr:hypothetical protein DPMN_088172 [Dreissena polymorpha]